MQRRNAAVALVVLFPFLAAAKGEGCAAPESEPQLGQETVDVSGDWSIEYQDDMEVEIAIGGAIYTETLGLGGGIVEIEHEGQPLRFDFDCARQEVVCPSEVWPGEFALDQRDAQFPHNVYVTIPMSECDGELSAADPAECGSGTLNEECADVCSGEVTTRDAETFGRITMDDSSLSVLIGGGAATNGYNCALLHLSIASATLESTGAAETGDLTAYGMPDGKLVTGVAGGCLWAGDVDADGTVDPAIVGAAITMTTSFTAERR